MHVGIHNVLLQTVYSVPYAENEQYSSSLWHTAVLILPSKRRYSPGWALASPTTRLQVSRFLALSLHPLTPIFLRFVYTSFGHLIFGLPLRLVSFLELRCLAFFLHDQAIEFTAVLILSWNISISQVKVNFALEQAMKARREVKV
jgi:hypothetical protein